MKFIILFLAFCLSASFCYAETVKRKAVVRKSDGVFVGWVTVGSGNPDSSKFNLIDADLLTGSENRAEFYKLENGKIKEKTALEIKTIKNAKKAIRTTRKLNKKKAIEKLKALGLTTDEILSFIN